MGFLKKSPRRPEPSPDSLLASAFSTANLMMGRVFEIETESLEGLAGNENQADVGLKTWEILQKAASSIFSDTQSFQLSQTLAISQQLSAGLRESYSRQLVQPANYEIARPEVLEELFSCLVGIRRLAMQQSGFNDVKNPLMGFSEDIAYRLGDIAMRKSFEWIPCFLNDFSPDWNSQKKCELGKPHLWDEVESDWKTTSAENQFFTAAVGMSISTYIFDPVRSLAIGSTGGTLNWMKAEDRGFELVARMLCLYKERYANI